MSAKLSKNNIKIQLREAVDTSFLNDSMYTNLGKDKIEEVKSESKNSMRPSDNKDEFVSFGMSRDFQNYVAKQLSQIIEKKIEQQMNYSPRPCELKNHPHKYNSRIKLLSTSERHLESIESLEQDNVKLPKRRKRNSEQKLNGDEIEKFKSATVTGEFILAQTDVAYWSKRTKRQPIVVRNNVIVE